MIHYRTLHSLEYDKITALIASQCQSAGGKDLAEALSPFAEKEQAEEAIILYEEFCRLLSANEGLSFTFPDVRPALNLARKKSSGAASNFYLDLDVLWLLRQLLSVAQTARAAIESRDGAETWPALLALAASAPFPQQFFAALCRCISDDGQLKDESSPELYRLRGELRNIHQTCLRKVKDFARQYNLQHYLQDDFMTLASDRYVLPLKANFKGRVQGIIHDWSQTGETCYFEPVFLMEINNRLQELKHEERQEEKKILEYLTSLLMAELDSVINCQDFLCQLDFLNAKLKFGQMLDAVPVSFTPEAEGIDLLQARHPVLELVRRDRKSPPVMPVNILLRPGEKILVITGGNAGGKTVCLKTLGLTAALAMSGLPAPCGKGSHIPWFDRVDAFIGDEQSLDEDVSTFTAQIEHLAKAWKHLGSHGLVLLDEFGAGTDPAEGAALAQAVLDELLQKNCFVLAATHFPALKSYALTRERVRAASMLFDPNTGRPLFKLAYDQIGASQALVVACKHGLPDSIIQRARHYLLQDGEDSSAVLDRLNHLAAEREKEIASLKMEKEKAQAILAEKKGRLDAERKRLAEDLSQKISSLMRNLKENKSTAKQTVKAMSGLRKELGLEHGESLLPQPETFHIGQHVYNIQFNKSGIIRDIDEKRQRARLEMNGVYLWSELKDLRQPSNAPAPRTEKGAVMKQLSPIQSLSLDLRGSRADEAIALLEKYLDKALLSGFSELEIIHGRGTGALRREIHEFLRGYPPVQSFALAPEDRGGDGMTIVTLG